MTDQANIEKINAQIEKQISELGFTTIGTSDERTLFTYTVGLTEMGHPEILLNGLNPFFAYIILNELGKRIEAGEKMPLYEDIGGIFTDLPARFVPTSPYAKTAYTKVADHRYGEDGFEVIQLVMPDPKGVFPAFAYRDWLQHMNNGCEPLTYSVQLLNDANGSTEVH